MKRWGVVTGIILACLFAANVQSIAQDSICACIHKTNGKARLVEDSSQCKGTELFVCWNECSCDVSRQELEALAERVGALEERLVCVDEDEDGYGVGIGCLGPDCNDQAPNAHPGGQEACDDSLDNDCDGLVDCDDFECYDFCGIHYLPHTPCDGTLPIEASNPLDAAKAIGLCDEVELAEWVMPDGSPSPDPLGYGIQSDFGPNVSSQEGSQMLVLSTGTARLPNQAGYIPPVTGYLKGYSSFLPPGYPKAVPGCFVSTASYDGVGLHVRVTVPLNATGFSFNFKYYTSDYPDYLCSTYNDFFEVMMSPAPAGLMEGSIAFDSQGAPITANCEFVEVCNDASCDLGPDELTGTGFEGHAATGWLEVTAPATGGATIDVLFTTWDSGDGTYDSTVVIDNWRWLTNTDVQVETKGLNNPQHS